MSDTVANFNFQFTSNADALEKQWDGLIKKANALNKALGQANKVIGEGVKVRREEVEVNHKRRVGRNVEIQQETRINRLRATGNDQLKRRVKQLGALAIAAVSAKKIMGGIGATFSAGVDASRQAKMLGVDQNEFENYARMTARHGGDRKTLGGNLQSLGTQLGDIRRKGGSPIIKQANSIGLRLRNDDDTDRGLIAIHKDMMRIIADGSEKDRNVLLSIMSDLGMDRSGALMAGMNKKQMAEEEADVLKQHQRTQQETQDLLDLSKAMTELGQSVTSIFDGLIAKFAPDLTGATNTLNDVLQGDDAPVKNYASKSMDAIVKGFLDYTPQGALIDTAGSVANWFEDFNFSDAMKSQTEAYRANQDYKGGNTTNTNNNMGGQSNTINVNSTEDANSVLRTLSTIDDTMSY